MKRTYVWDPETKQMVEVTRDRSASSFHYVMGDLKDFVSPIDGTVISDRGQLRRYMKANDLAMLDDFKGVPERKRAEREAHEARERKQGVADAYEHCRNQQRAKARFG